MSKVIVSIASGIVGLAVAILGAAAGMAAQLLKVAVTAAFGAILVVALVVAAIVAIVLLTACGPTAETTVSGEPGQAVRATDTPPPAVAASKPTAAPPDTSAPTATTVPQSNGVQSTPQPQSKTTDPAATSPPSATPEPTSEPEYEIVTLLPPDAIPAISDPSFVSAEEAGDQYDRDELVLGVEIDGDARAYSVPLLSRHEIVNDVVGGKPIAVTW